MKGKKILITGTSSGIGRYLKDHLICESFNRSSSYNVNQNNTYEIIIHCAFNMNRLENHENFYEYLEDTLTLTRSLTSIKHKLFIFLSSIDVYPSNGLEHDETEMINPSQLSSVYPIFKLACESIVKKKSVNCLILRPGMLLGPYMRKNNLTKILFNQEKKLRLSLSASSCYHCVLYEDILSTIQYALKFPITGTYNIVRSKKVSIGNLVQLYNPTLEFGAYTYSPDPISNEKIVNLVPSLKKSSLQAVEEFISINKSK